MDIIYLIKPDSINYKITNKKLLHKYTNNKIYDEYINLIKEVLLLLTPTIFFILIFLSIQSS